MYIYTYDYNNNNNKTRRVCSGVQEFLAIKRIGIAFKHFMNVC